MIYGIKVIFKYLLGTDIADRNLAVYPDDTFVVSYPRSGNTWTRFLIANLVFPSESVTFTNIERLIPDTSSQSSRALKRTPRPRIIKSHTYFDPRYPRVLYIVRDPRDLVLSYYNFQRKYRQLADDYPLADYVGDFVNGRLISSGWGSWGENVASWIYTRQHHGSFLLLRYEDMKSDTERELKRIAAFLGLKPTPERLRQAIEASSPERMREMERTQSDQWVATKKHRKDIPFVGTAVSGRWQSELTGTLVSKIESTWGDLMSTLGYPLVASEGSKTHSVLQ
ncbi:MAG TPA: sulfotransferase domain-containing protein [Candidatus Eremiobacteraceae bacterium]|nr:sulfotransferase domain-containing protein [Candidatus Eremiobacteraceae bacterium]